MDSNNHDLPAVTVASKVNFSELCGLLEKISKTQGNEKKKRILKDFIDQWRKSHQLLHGTHKTTTDSFYPAMRLLLPHLEKERVAYGIKEHMFAKLLIEVLCLGKDSPDAHRLLNYKAPKTAKADVGDFASVVYFVLQNRCPSRGTLFIQEVNDCLDGIATNNAAKKKDAVRKHIVKLITNMSALELKWLTRMIVKELKVGLSQSSVLSVFHPDAEEFYNVNNNLEKVCRMMHDPSVRIHEIGISVFSPFTPMLGERASPDKVEKLMEGKAYYIETKYDGERMLLHKDENDYKFFSRSGNEYTSIFGSNQFDGTLTQYIHNLFKPDVKTCILDGEMILYHPETKTYATKAMNTDVKSSNRDGFQPCLHVFDVVFYNDKVLTNLPLKERLNYLEKIITPEEGRLVISEHKEAKTNQDCADALNEAIDGREEGIMVKNPESVYRPNTRKGGWFKVKPEYVGGLMDELDVLVVGGYFGVGHRAGMMSHFLCAVAVPSAEGNHPELFYSFCKIGSGYSKKELQDFNAKLVDHWQAFDKKNPPKCIELAPGFKEKPDAWIEPSKSAIVQIKAAEIIDSDRFRCGFTLRFPRVEKFRDDKEWYDCMTLEEVEQLKQKSGGKLAGGYVELGEEQEPTKKKRKIVSRAVRPTLGSQFKAADTSSVKQVSKMLEGKEICVINGPLTCSKQELEKKVVECGGTVVQNPGIETYCVVVDKIVFRVNNMIKSNHYDIVKAEWLIKCFDAGTLIPWTPGDMVNATEKTQRLFQQDFDEFGDSYVEETTSDKLAQVFDKIQPDPGDDTISPTEIAELEDKYFPDESPYGLFRMCKIYLDNNLLLGDKSTHIRDSSLDLLALELRFFGAKITDRLSPDVSHVMIDESDLSRVSELKKERRTRDKKFHIVTPAWVKQCMEEGSVINERAFEPVVEN